MGDNGKISKAIFLSILLLTFLSCTTPGGVTRKRTVSNNIKPTRTEIKKKAREENEKSSNAKLLYLEAKKAFNRGDFVQCINLLARERRSYFLSPLSRMRNLYLSGLCLLKSGDAYRAKYFFKRVIAEAGKLKHEGENGESIEKILGKVYSTLGLVFYREKLYDQALNYMNTVIKEYMGVLSRRELSRVYLMMSDILYYKKKNIPLARFYFKKIDLQLLDNDERNLYKILGGGLKWENIRCAHIGLADENISILTYDGNDLWIGTWNGGLARYNMYRDEVKVFKTGNASIVPKTIRAIRIVGQNVWVGSYEGLAYYSKRSGKWYNVSIFSGKNKTSVEAIERVGRKIYIGTLGRGLWVLNLNAYLNVSESKRWKKIDMGGAFKFINCLAAYENYLIIGTMDKGVFFFNVKSGKLVNLASLSPDFKPVNITTFLVENDNSLWIGTYGKGLYNWNPRNNTLTVFTKENGLLSDDWVLDSGKGKRFLYFGTFGGGVVVFDRVNKKFKVFTLESGLDSMDISSVAVSDGVVAFGTLGMGISLYFGESN